MIFNKEQHDIIEAAVNWYKYSSELVFQYCGLAGTGKSLVLSEIIKKLGIPRERIATMAYTGAAAIVLRQKGIDNAKTIHSWLYKPVESYIYDQDGKVVMDEYLNRPKFHLTFEPKPLDNIDLIVIDEASMVPMNMKSEIESRGIKIIATGDLGQLPPVADEPAYLYDGDVMKLTKIFRQSEDSGIVYIADRVRKGLPVAKGRYNEVIVIDEDELTDEMVMMSDVVLCGKNKTRDFINNKIRYLNGFKGDLPVFGDVLVCRKNNWTIEENGINLANGLRGRVANHPSVEGFDGRTFTIDFLPDGFDSCFEELKCDYKYLVAPTNQKNYIKNDRFGRGEKMEFGYCLTTHLSQGSQYRNVIYIEEFLSQDIQNRLNYTGVTRATNSLIYVKRKKKYY